ncbi:hypothetical protein SSBR45G_05060 [Bradyrhizobium sp. SSBR45G]|uniref:hypothetical protein n=1 Tax=unclassified Bradyrhizobium TaxID=2631580 RepID=UPI0023429168|nr:MULTISPECIES: hypothetical protein [unclassified Bradyrhizobium]GLH75598.1 hypothetical protein SSBR45G_05060 [Bradyrhizobium sp. SSBR45G]GLH82612.1 hypothetical protein SSBR45R_00720 [Bradyrhizobium sp. SSBR45R]
MQVIVPGRIQDFSSIRPGDFFMYLVEDKQHWGMLTHANDQTAPLSFTEPSDKDSPVPCIHDSSSFLGRAVFVFPGAEARPVWPLVTRGGAPKSNEGFGSLVQVSGTTLLRVKGARNNWDVNLADGKAQSASVNPNATTIVNWEIGLWDERAFEFKQILQFPRLTTRRTELRA